MLNIRRQSQRGSHSSILSCENMIHGPFTLPWIIAVNWKIGPCDTESVGRVSKQSNITNPKPNTKMVIQFRICLTLYAIQMLSTFCLFCLCVCPVVVFIFGCLFIRILFRLSKKQSKKTNKQETVKKVIFQQFRVYFLNIV